MRPWLLAWLGLPVLGIANGVIRDATYKQVLSEPAAHQLSTATLLMVMTAYIWTLERRWPIPTSRSALGIGGSWALLTILFELGFGHYVVGDSWSSLLQAYNLADGRVGRRCRCGRCWGRRSSGGCVAVADQPARSIWRGSTWAGRDHRALAG